MGKPKQFAILGFYSMGFSNYYMKHHELVIPAEPCSELSPEDAVCYLQIGYEYSWRTRLKGENVSNG